MGIKGKESLQGTIKQNPVLAEFNQTLQSSASLQRYQVTLPFKDNASKEDLVNNLGICIKRLDNMHKKLDEDPELCKKYYGVLGKYEEHKIIERIHTGEIHKKQGVYYMPHRPVIKEGSVSSRVRPVFDCSSKTHDGISLNSLLETGPSLNPDIFAVMLRFRRWPIAISGDVIQAFLQLFVRPADRDVHRFVIRENGKVVHMRFTRVPFGNTASPFMLNAVVRFHLSCFPDSDIVQELKEDIFVDNYLGGADSVEEAISKKLASSEIVGSAGLTLSKWISNSKLVSEHFGNSEAIGEKHHEMILGIKWMATSDIFYFDGLEPNLCFSITKRALLSILSRLYDPIGFICPFILKAKILFQTIWRQGYGWDDSLAVELAEEFQTWLEESKNLGLLQFPRSYFLDMAWLPMSDRLELHAFGDASEKGYGAVVYLRVQIGSEYHVAFVAARSRVAPLKKVSLPRLELLGSLMCARLVDYVQTALKLSKV